MDILEILAGAGALQFFNWIREKYGEEIKANIEKSFEKFNWATASGQYRRKVGKDFNILRLYGTDAPVKLNDIFTDVYLLNNSDAYEYHRILDATRRVPKNKRIGGLDFVKQGHNFIYILGKPGSGKTTFLKHIAVKASESEIERIPILIYLKDWARSGFDLFDFLVKEFDICKFPAAKPLVEYILETGQAIILLDGLDEVPESNHTRSNIIQQIKDFTKKYDDNQFLMTCRIAATDYTFQNFRYLRMADFEPHQIKIYIKNWFKGKSIEKYKLFKKELFDPKNKRFLEMASQPLLLSLLCINFNETMTFSERRTDIYEEAIGVLIEKWSSFNDVLREDVFELSKNRKMQLFSEIAYKNFSKDSDYDRFQKNDLMKQFTAFLCKVSNAPHEMDIDSEKVLRSFESNNSILIERYKNIYSFGHLSFQEYFTARYISERDLRIRQLLVPNRINQDRWREVILNTASLISDGDDFFKNFFDSINIIFVHQTEAEVQLQKLLRQINNKVQQVRSKRKIRAIRFFYLHLLILEARSRNIQHDPNQSDELNNHIDHLLSEMRYLNPDSNLDRSLRFAFTNTRDYLNNPKRVLNTDFVPSPDPDLAFDYLIFIFSFAVNSFYWHFRFMPDSAIIAVKLGGFLQKATEAATFLRNRIFLDTLDEIIPPQEDMDLDAFILIKKQIDRILEIRGIKSEIRFIPKFVLLLNQYLLANSLLLECLDLASVADRNTIEDKILSPPERLSFRVD